MQIVVVGLGKVGMPLAAQFAEAGHHVVGVDPDATTVALVNLAVEPFPGEAQLQEKLSILVPAGRLRATTDYAEAVPHADTVVVAVPLLVNDRTWEPDFAAIDAATKALAEHLTRGTLVSYETTLPVGTTRNRWKPMIEKASGLTEGEDFHLVVSAERVMIGRVFEDLRKYPKLIGGLSPAGRHAAREFYQAVLQFDDRPDLPCPSGVWDMVTPEAAEMAKLAETTYRDVNIALANQFAMYADKENIDIEKVIDACNSQPFSHIHRPGIAVGGLCIPVHSRLYLSTDPDASIVREGRQVNAHMPAYAVSRLRDILGDLAGQRVAILGASFRGEVKETTFSGVFALVDLLRGAGANPAVHDPFYPDREMEAFGWAPYRLGKETDVVMIQADHAAYRDLEAADFPGVKLLFDGRRVTDPAKWVGTPRVVIGA